MDDLERVQKQIDQLTAPVRQVTKTLNKVMPPYIKKINEVMGNTAHQLDKISKAYEPFITQVNATVTKIAKAAHKWQIARKEDVTVMAENGWYPNWYTFFYSPKEPPSSLDELMIMHLEENWEDLSMEILKHCHNRKHILENAFELHKSGNYVAAIPLFLSQADGICCEVLKSFLFSGNETEEKIKELIDQGEIEINMFTDIFLEPFKLKNHHNAGISKASEAAKGKAPNRNGIMHGHRKHLDYGTKINSLKCFSLLSFVVYTTKDLINET